MTTAQTLLGSLVQISAPWHADWIWGCPLIVITVIIHVLGLSSMTQKAIPIYNDLRKHCRPTAAATVVIGAAALLATLLHGLEAAIWALTYRFIGSLPDTKSAMLYSLGALTTYGHHSVFLEDRWQLLGVLEALDGWLLFGLSTAFLFMLFQEFSPVGRAVRQIAEDNRPSHLQGT
jgi:hypothetical protein